MELTVKMFDVLSSMIFLVDEDVKFQTHEVNSSSLLVSDTYFDIDGDGSIDSGNELFGNYHQDDNGDVADDGFEALGKYDVNQDGVIDHSDNVYQSLQVWVDENQDGKTDEGELHSLDEL